MKESTKFVLVLFIAVGVFSTGVYLINEDYLDRNVPGRLDTSVCPAEGCYVNGPAGYLLVVIAGIVIVVWIYAIIKEGLKD